MNRKTGAAIVSTIIGVVIVSSVAVSGISARSSDVVAPTASATAPAAADATARPSVTPTPVEIPKPSTSPVVVDTAFPPSDPTAAPSPITSTVRLPKITEKVGGAAKVKYFRVSGESPIALIDNTVLSSKASCKSADTLACVFPRPSIRWTDRTRIATGACTIVAAQVGIKPIVYLPQWVSPKAVQPELLAWWKKMVDHMAWHEGQHIKIQKSYDAKLKAMMVGDKCSSANKTIKAWERSLKAAQDKFDAKDALWPYPVYAGPGGFYGTDSPA